MTAKELLDRYAAGERDFGWAYLSGANLGEADLRWADLRWAYLTGACLTGADLHGANLIGAYLSGANLSGANLTGAYLSGAYLSGAYLSGAKFGDKEILSSGSIGPAASSGRHATWLVFTDGSTHCFTGCFSGSIDELDRQSAQKHNGADREWYESAIAHIRLSARIALEKRPYTVNQTEVEMSNDKGRDWMKEPEFVSAAIAHDRGDIFIWEVADAVESIVRKELAEKVDGLPCSGYYGQYVRIDNVLSLLTDNGKEQ